MHGFTKKDDDAECWEAHHKADILIGCMASTSDIPGLSQPALQAILGDHFLRIALWQLLPRAVQLGAGSSPETGPRPVQPEAMHNSSHVTSTNRWETMGDNTHQAWTLTGPVQ